VGRAHGRNGTVMHLVGNTNPPRCVKVEDGAVVHHRPPVAEPLEVSQEVERPDVVLASQTAVIHHFHQMDQCGHQPVRVRTQVRVSMLRSPSPPLIELALDRNERFCAQRNCTSLQLVEVPQALRRAQGASLKGPSTGSGSPAAPRS
jgi:hypothetical protein